MPKDQPPSVRLLIVRWLSLFLAVTAAATVIGRVYVGAYRQTQAEKSLAEHVATTAIHPTEDHLRLMIDQSLAPVSQRLTGVETELRLRGQQLNRIEESLQLLARRQASAGSLLRERDDRMAVGKSDEATDRAR